VLVRSSIHSEAAMHADCHSDRRRASAFRRGIAPWWTRYCDSVRAATPPASPSPARHAFDLDVSSDRRPGWHPRESRIVRAAARHEHAAMEEPASNSNLPRGPSYWTVFCAVVFVVIVGYAIVTAT